MKKIIMIAVGVIGSVLHALPEGAERIGYPIVVLIRETNPSDDLIKSLIYKSLIYKGQYNFNSYEEYSKKMAELIEGIKNISDADLAILKQKDEQRKKEHEELRKQLSQPAPQKDPNQAQRYVDESRQKRAEVVINKFTETWSDAAVKNAWKDLVHTFVVAWKPSLTPQQQSQLQSVLEVGINNVASGERKNVSEQDQLQMRVYSQAIQNEMKNSDTVKRLLTSVSDAAETVRDQFKQK